jgi:hypothetical protein
MKLINTLIAVTLTGSLVLIATKHHVVSLLLSVFATALVVATLIPTERVGEDEVFRYAPDGRVTIQPKKPKKPKKQRIQVTQETPDSLPACDAPPLPPSDREMRDHIRNNGMYGIQGNLSCKLLQRGTVADKGMLQPLNARNQMLKFLSVDQKHAKDSHLIPRNPK